MDPRGVVGSLSYALLAWVRLGPATLTVQLLLDDYRKLDVEFRVLDAFQCTGGRREPEQRDGLQAC